MRLRHRSAEETGDVEEFSDYVKIGNGRHDTDPDLTPDYALIPSDLLIPPADESMRDIISTFKLNVRRVVDYMYADIGRDGCNEFQYLSDRAILTPLNVDVEKINSDVMRRLPGDHHDYLSISTVECEQEFQRDIYPVEFLNTITVSGLPTHRLRLKVGASVLVMRNLNPGSGPCNGTRLIIRHLAPHCIHATIMNGTFKGQPALIPRISLVNKEIGLPFQIRRKQFPVQFAFAMTINKAQGQPIPKLAIYLPQPVFSHGQLYVALSRVTSRSNFRLLIVGAEQPTGVAGPSYTRNIVHRELIQ